MNPFKSFKSLILLPSPFGEGLGVRPLFTFLFSLFTLFSSCSSEQKRIPDTYVSETTYIDADTTAYTLEETGGDTLLVGSSPYHDTMQALESYHDRWESVASPDMLQTVLATYENDIQALREKIDEATQSPYLTSDEAERLRSTWKGLETLKTTKQGEYSIPAAGVIATIKNVEKRLNECRSKQEFNRITEARTSFFQQLSTLHLIVSEESKQREVRSLAHQLQRVYDAKRQEFQ